MTNVQVCFECDHELPCRHYPDYRRGDAAIVYNAHRAGYELARMDALKSGWHLLDYDVMMKRGGVMAEYPEQIARWKCSECWAICTEPLQAAHPFIAGDTVCGCPDCFAVQSLDAACYRKNCNELATIGSPNAHGFRYVVTCHKHRPLKQNDA